MTIADVIYALNGSTPVRTFTVGDFVAVYAAESIRACYGWIEHVSETKIEMKLHGSQGHGGVGVHPTNVYEAYLSFAGARHVFFKR